MASLTQLEQAMVDALHGKIQAGTATTEEVALYTAGLEKLQGATGYQATVVGLASDALSAATGTLNTAKAALDASKAALDGYAPQLATLPAIQVSAAPCAGLLLSGSDTYAAQPPAPTGQEAWFGQPFVVPFFDEASGKLYTAYMKASDSTNYYVKYSFGYWKDGVFTTLSTATFTHLTSGISYTPVAFILPLAKSTDAGDVRIACVFSAISTAQANALQRVVSAKSDDTAVTTSTGYANLYNAGLHAAYDRVNRCFIGNNGTRIFWDAELAGTDTATYPAALLSERARFIEFSGYRQSAGFNRFQVDTFAYAGGTGGASAAKRTSLPQGPADGAAYRYQMNQSISRFFYTASRLGSANPTSSTVSVERELGGYQGDDNFAMSWLHRDAAGAVGYRTALYQPERRLDFTAWLNGSVYNQVRRELPGLRVLLLDEARNVLLRSYLPLPHYPAQRNDSSYIGDAYGGLPHYAVPWGYDSVKRRLHVLVGVTMFEGSATPSQKSSHELIYQL